MLQFLGACHWHHSCHWLLQEVGKHSHSYCWAVERHLDWQSDPGFLGVSCVFMQKWGCSVCGTFHFFKRLNQPTIFDINCDFSEKQGLLRFNSERARETRKQATQKNKPLHISIFTSAWRHVSPTKNFYQTLIKFQCSDLKGPFYISLKREKTRGACSSRRVWRSTFWTLRPKRG